MSTSKPPLQEGLRVAYTRGRKLHAAKFEEGKKTAHTLCGAFGYRHPKFDSPSVAVGLSLSFNDGCQRCLRELES